MAEKSDFYDILGVAKGASDAEIKKAYRNEALKWHPDRHQGKDKEEAEKKFKQINEAYQILSDSKKRSAYDQFGHSAFSPGGGARAGGNPFAGGFSGTGPFTYTYTTRANANGFSGFDFGDPFDIFESFFGGGSPFARGRQKQIPRYSIEIDFMDAINGVEKEVSVEGKKRKIKIPKGVDEGTRINFNDFILSVNIKPHEMFERDGADIYVKLDIPYSLAVLGGFVEVPTVYKPIKIRIVSGTKSGTMYRLKGEGVPYINSNKKGDQYVKINVIIPERLTRYQKDLINKLQKEGL